MKRVNSSLNLRLNIIILFSKRTLESVFYKVFFLFKKTVKMSEILVTTVAEIMADTKTSENCRNRQFGIGFGRNLFVC